MTRSSRICFPCRTQSPPQVSDVLAVTFTGAEKDLLSKRHTDDVEAYQLYVLGRYHLTSRWTREPKSWNIIPQACLSGFADSTICEGGNTGQFFTSQKLKRCATTG